MHFFFSNKHENDIFKSVPCQLNIYKDSLHAYNEGFSSEKAISFNLQYISSPKIEFSQK